MGGKSLPLCWYECRIDIPAYMHVEIKVIVMESDRNILGIIGNLLEELWAFLWKGKLIKCLIISHLFITRFTGKTSGKAFLSSWSRRYWKVIYLEYSGCLLQREVSDYALCCLLWNCLSHSHWWLDISQHAWNPHRDLWEFSVNHQEEFLERGASEKDKADYMGWGTYVA